MLCDLTHVGGSMIIDTCIYIALSTQLLEDYRFTPECNIAAEPAGCFSEPDIYRLSSEEVRQGLHVT